MAYKKNAKVQWKWMGRFIAGNIEEIYDQSITKTIKGKKITRHGSKDKPAYLVKSEAGNLALKLESELVPTAEMSKISKKAAKKSKPKMFLTIILGFMLLYNSDVSASVCVFDRGVFSDQIVCKHKSKKIIVDGFSRDMQYVLPAGKAPENGWPAVIIYQGTASPVEFKQNSWSRFNRYYETATVAKLLENGFAVFAPRAKNKAVWMTNIPGVDYDSSEDFKMVKKLLENMRDQKYGQINMKHIFAAGFSSGGYHTSRMALAFAGAFKAFAIQSGSYADCAGMVCSVPENLPFDHPPTLFLHGGFDAVVPAFTATSYHDKLLKNGITTQMYIDKYASHEWLDQSPQIIRDWFLKNLD